MSNLKCVARLALLSLLVVSGASAQTTSVLPGYWEGDDHWSITIASKREVTKKCLTAQQVEEWLTRPTPKHYKCVYSEQQVADGHVSLRGQCRDKKGQGADLAIKGTYAPEEFHLRADLQIILIGVPIPGHAVIDAHRLSPDCPPGVVPGK
jgi:hypothetical protein